MKRETEGIKCAKNCCVSTPGRGNIHTETAETLKIYFCSAAGSRNWSLPCQVMNQSNGNESSAKKTIEDRVKSGNAN